jgi:two-component system KDP operon response regulator KdpE
MLARTMTQDVVLLDMNMPGMDGLQTCRELRNTCPRLAILMLTVRESEEDNVRPFEAGADDYITKPLHIRELMARVRAAVRRVRALESDKNSCIRIGDIELAPERREVLKRGRPRSFDAEGIRTAGVSNDPRRSADFPWQLLKAIWGPEYEGEVEYLRTFAHQLRKKIEHDASAPRYLITDMRIGYRFREDVDVSVSGLRRD